MPINPLTIELLSAIIEAEQLPFSSFEDLPASDEFLGQERAKKALAFGLKNQRNGYNLFVMGITACGRFPPHPFSIY